MNRMLRTLVVSALLAGSASSAHAVVVSWTDWHGAVGSAATGHISYGDQTVGVTFSGNFSSISTGGSSGYWFEGTPPAYTGGVVENAPVNDELILLSPAGTRTITFSKR